MIELFRMESARQWARDMGLGPSDLETQYACFDEERDEFRAAKTPLDQLDALADMLQVMACIQVCEGNIDKEIDVFEQCFVDSPFSISQVRDALAEVVRSNYTKFCEDEYAAAKEILNWGAKGVAAGYRKVSPELYKLISLCDQYDRLGSKFYPALKVLKPKTYQEPNLARIIGGADL